MILVFILCFPFTVANWNVFSSPYFYYTVEMSQCLQGEDSSGKDISVTRLLQYASTQKQVFALSRILYLTAFML